MNYVQPPQDATDSQQRVTEAMNQLLAVLEPYVAEPDIDFDAFSAVFAFTRPEEKPVVERLDIFYYVLEKGVHCVQFNPNDVEKEAIALVEAASEPAGFNDKAAALFAFRRDTKKMSMSRFFDGDAEPAWVTEETMDDVAMRVNPFNIPQD